MTDLYQGRGWRPKLSDLAHLNPDSIVDIMTADLGIEYRMLASSDAGRALIMRAFHELVDAWEKLETVDPDSPSEIRRIQMQAQVARRFVEWLNEGISTGEAAEQSISQRDQLDVESNY
jgi:hypothetical protein